MSAITFNQNIMIPAIFHGQMPQHQTQTINDVSHHVFSNQPHALRINNQYQPLPGYQPFNITIMNNNHCYQQQTTPSCSIMSTSSSMKNSNMELSGQQNDILAAAVMSALHETPNSTEFYNSVNKEYDTPTSHQESSPHGQTDRLPDRSPLSELRLPPIKTTPNVAANVMSEETDLGYCSFSDISTFQEISETMNYSDVSDDMFDDVKSNFSDIIDDVLDNIDNTYFTKTEPLSPPVQTELNSTDECFKLEHYQRPHELSIKQDSMALKENYCDLVNIHNMPTCAGFVPYIMPQNVHSRFGVTQSGTDAYCQLCDKYFQTKASLRVHMRQHRGERPHHCPFCQKSFTQKSTLRTHIRTHTGERPYICQFCARAFGDYSTYRKHVRVHTGEKPYTCDVCKKSFTQSGNMIRHREVHFKKQDKKK